MDGRRDIHVVLPDSLVLGLDQEAHRRGVRRVHLIREAVAEYLARSASERLAQELIAYADEMADPSGEFVAETAAHTADRLLRETEW